MNFEQSNCFLNGFLRHGVLGLEFIDLYWTKRQVERGHLSIGESQKEIACSLNQRPQTKLKNLLTEQISFDSLKFQKSYKHEDILYLLGNFKEKNTVVQQMVKELEMGYRTFHPWVTI